MLHVPADIVALAAVLGLLVGLVVGWVHFSHVRVRGRLRPVAEGLGLRFHDRGGRDLPHTLRGDWEGLAVEVRYVVGGRGERDRLQVSVLSAGAVSVAVRFRKETAVHGLAKAVGLVREPQAGSLNFDREVFVDTEDDERATALVADRHVREIVLRLLRVPRCLVVADPSAVGVTVQSHWGWRELFEPASLRPILADLRDLAVRLREVGAARDVAEGGSGVRAAAGSLGIEGSTFVERMRALAGSPSAAVMVGACALMFAGPLVLVLGLRYPTVGWALEGAGLAGAAVLLVAYTGVVYARLRGRSRSHSDFATFMFAGLLGMPTFLVGGLKAANGILDRGEAVAVAAEVVSVAGGPAREGSRRVRLRLGSGDSAFIATVRVPVARLERLAPGEPLTVLLSPGGLGERRVLGVE